MQYNRTLRIVIVAVLVALAGCSSGGLLETTDDGDQSSNDAGWCNEGDSTQWTNPETGEQVTLSINGTTTYEGKEVCVGSWRTDSPDSDVVRTEYMYTEDGSYTRWVTYDANGDIVNEFETTGQVSNGGDATRDGTSGTSWCPTGQSFTSSSPETGEVVSFEYQGLTTEDGNDVCKAVWEADNADGEIVRTEYYFNQEGTYTKWVSYDANGNVVDETIVDTTN